MDARLKYVTVFLKGNAQKSEERKHKEKTRDTNEVSRIESLGRNMSKNLSLLNLPRRSKLECSEIKIYLL